MGNEGGSKLSSLGAVLSKGKAAKSPEPEEEGSDLVEPTEAVAVLSGFMTRMKNENRRFQDAVDNEYWCCLIFQSRAQKDAWLKALGLFELGDKYLDGEEVAAAMKIKLPAGPEWKEPKLKYGKGL